MPSPRCAVLIGAAVMFMLGGCANPDLPPGVYDPAAATSEWHPPTQPPAPAVETQNPPGQSGQQVPSDVGATQPLLTQPALTQPPATQPASTEPASTQQTDQPALVLSPTSPAATSPAATSTSTTLEITPKSYNGHGDQVIQFDPISQRAVVTFTHNGSRNFAVTALDSSGAMQDLLVNTIGGYVGTRLIRPENNKTVAALKIEADGDWTAEMKPMSAARVWSGPHAEGRGDDVLRLDPPAQGLTVVQATHSGQRNFAVIAHGTSYLDLVINKIGNYSGEVQLPSGTAFVEIEADGDWSFTRN